MPPTLAIQNEIWPVKIRLSRLFCFRCNVAIFLSVNFRCVRLLVAMQISRIGLIRLAKLALVAVVPFSFSTSAQAKAARPNIIFILADDLGYSELGSYGQKKIKTPNLDRLATQGMRFTRNYSGNAVCAPSRCVLTVSYTHLTLPTIYSV